MSATHTPLRIPDHMSRADIGAYMRELRLHYGLTESDVSERLHIRVRYVSAIEQADFDAMPGRAYARGYLHNYAEFLGLDAEQVVERCFGPEMAHAAQAHSVPQSSIRARSRQGAGVFVVVLILGLLGYWMFGAAPEGDEAAVTTRVPAVPETMLQHMRTQAMPSAQTFDCFGAETYLGCYRAQALTRRWVNPAPPPDMAPAPVEPKADANAETNTDDSPAASE